MATTSFLSEYKKAWKRKHGEGDLGAVNFAGVGVITTALSIFGGLFYTAFFAEDSGDWGSAVSKQETNEHVRVANKLNELDTTKRSLDNFITASQSPHVIKTFGKADVTKLELAKQESAALDERLKDGSKKLVTQILMNKNLSEEDTKELLFKSDHGIVPLDYRQEWQRSFNPKHGNMIQECRVQFNGIPAEKAVPGILACATEKTAESIIYTPVKFGVTGWLTTSLGLPFLTAAGAYSRRRREEKNKDLVQQTISIKMTREP